MRLLRRRCIKRATTSILFLSFLVSLLVPFAVPTLQNDAEAQFLSDLSSSYCVLVDKAPQNPAEQDPFDRENCCVLCHQPPTPLPETVSLVVWQDFNTGQIGLEALQDLSIPSGRIHDRPTAPRAPPVYSA